MTDARERLHDQMNSNDTAEKKRENVSKIIGYVKYFTLKWENQ